MYLADDTLRNNSKFIPKFETANVQEILLIFISDTIIAMFLIQNSNGIINFELFVNRLRSLKRKYLKCNALCDIYRRTTRNSRIEKDKKICSFVFPNHDEGKMDSLVLATGPPEKHRLLA
ncbi:hypothetical protein WN51_12154 [Melipona quadrifasciata]|uniref:Uncharacterized protein n=1 Tax=Melipona quadrifasciata TaxID=166423 RepID=A0A0M9A5P5_9HYME|nr:hypothetical protein WN51_12154 [Melipona quadrifasciata]